MENGLYIGLSRQLGLRQQLDMVANNLANSNTGAYRADRMAFHDLLVRTQATTSSGNLAFNEAVNISRDPREGALQITRDPLDVALRGDGWFSVLAPQGTLYTRSGTFVIDSENQLALPDGNLLLDRGEQTITLPEGWESISISPEGVVYVDNDRITQLSVVEFDNKAALEKLDSLYYRASDEQARIFAERTTVLQGARELSNVEPVSELVQLIDVERNYQLMTSYLNLEDERAQEMIRTLTRI